MKGYGHGQKLERGSLICRQCGTQHKRVIGLQFSHYDRKHYLSKQSYGHLAMLLLPIENPYYYNPMDMGVSE